MREDIFYWKCDAPLAAERKKTLYREDKYASAAMAEIAAGIARAFGGARASAPSPFGGDGNHYAYTFACDGRELFLRADDGQTGDDYMLAESAVMTLARRRGVPAPEVFATDVSRARFPVAYQIMERVDAPNLNTFHHAGTLDRDAVARAFGEILARLHAQPFDGAGFVDTGRLARDGTLRGLDANCAAYFHKRLDGHLRYVVDHALLAPEEGARAERAFARGAPLLTHVPPALLHRDFTYWNTLGAPDRVVAVIDWDDAVGGDPADDVGIVNCFFEPDLMETLLARYGETRPVDEAFRARMRLHTLRNLLWKAKIRHQLGYFDQPDRFFLAKNDLGLSLRDYTARKLRQALAETEERL